MCASTYTACSAILFYIWNQKIGSGRCRIWILSFLLAFLLQHSTDLRSQYQNVTDVYDLGFFGASPMFGNGLSFYDFNKDGLDDLTFCSNEFGVFTYINTGNGFENIDLFGSLPGDFKHPIWVDYDNDGDADFFGSRALDDLVLMRNDGDLIFTDVSDLLWMPYETVMTMGCTWGDYNEDGYLDLYVGNYHQSGEITNWLFRNNQDGTFTEWAGVLGIDNGVKPAYQTLFVDYDVDGDMDLIVINDKHKGNFIYRNNEGEFTDISVESGFYSPCNGMSATTCDYDHDGDFDFYVTNTEQGNKFYRNENGMFNDIAPDLGLACYGFCWGAVWLDTNNDITEDLFVTGGSEVVQENYYFANASQNDDYSVGFFSDSPDMDLPSYSVAKGDLNNDGFYDLAVSHIIPVQATLWLGPDTSGNSWIKVSLEGTLSNRDGIGAIVHCYAGDDHVVRQLLCGENFLSQDSQHMIIGMGENTVIDSLNINWPNGWVDHYENLSINNSYDFVEGDSFTQLNSVSNLVVCPNDSILLDLNTNNYVLWENGDTTIQRWINTSGIFNATVTNSFGFQYTSYFEVDIAPVPSIEPEVVNPLCAGSNSGMIELNTQDNFILSYLWSDGDNDSFHDELFEGLYECVVTTDAGCNFLYEFELDAPEQITLLNDLNQSICFEASTAVSPEITGGVEPINIFWQNLDPAAVDEGEYSFEVIDANGCIEVFDFVITSFPQIEIVLYADTICPGTTTEIEYSATGGTGNLSFDFDELDPQNAGVGFYQILVTDENFCSATSSIEIVDWDDMQVNANITNAQNGPNGAIQVEVQGGHPPYVYSWNGIAGDAINDNLEQGTYSCVVTDSFGCQVELSLNVIDTSIDEASFEYSVFPVPFSDILNINVPSGADVRIYNCIGELIWIGNGRTFYSVGTEHWSEGLYLLISGNHKVYELIKQ